METVCPERQIQIGTGDTLYEFFSERDMSDTFSVACGAEPDHRRRTEESIRNVRAEGEPDARTHCMEVDEDNLIVKD